jgi:2-hydroxy-4-carboxymuconate semialdehyde hemiacetal dehydrogenase
VTLHLCLAGEGAIARSRIEALRRISGVDVVSHAGGVAESAASFAQEWARPQLSMELDECLSSPGIDAVILATPSHLHAT